MYIYIYIYLYIGRIDSSKKALNQQIGELFVEQTEVNLFSSILDTPGRDVHEFLYTYMYF
jgi:uncharacterized Rmd1/YagE family protein